MINATISNSSNLGLSCTYYGKNNNTIDKCYRKNGFPQNYASRGGKNNQGGYGRGNFNGKGSKLCTHCGFTNHTLDECYRKHGYPPRHKFHKTHGSSINNLNVSKEEGDITASEQNQDA